MAYDKGRYGGLPDAYGRTGASQSLTPGEVQRLRQQLTSRPTRTVDLPALTATANDLSLPPDALLVRQNTNGANQSVSGFAGGTPGRIIYYRNMSANTITLLNESAGSQAGNRIILGAATGSIVTGGVAVLIYDGTQQRWILVSRLA